MLISPAEPPLIKTLGTVSATPEKYGADILWSERNVSGLVGIQRKEVSDFVASVGDGRLNREMIQLRAVNLPILIIEGNPHWTLDGVLVHKYTRWTRAQHNSLLRSIQMRGVIVESTASVAETIKRVEEIAKWAAKADHTSLDRRPKPGPDEWGKVTDKAWGLHMLQSVPGIGPKQAEVIWDHFGRLPLGLTVSREELMAIRGLGNKRVADIMKAFGQPSPE